MLYFSFINYKICFFPSSQFIFNSPFLYRPHLHDIFIKHCKITLGRLNYKNKYRKPLCSAETWKGYLKVHESSIPSQAKPYRWCYLLWISKINKWTQCIMSKISLVDVIHVNLLLFSLPYFNALRKIHFGTLPFGRIGQYFYGCFF